jgi:hypothetical protein
MIDFLDTEELIERCFNEMQEASRNKYDTDKADKTAALFLMAQMKLSFLIEEVEMKAKNAKNEITRIEGEKYFEYKTINADKKVTENMITNFVAKEADIVSARRECASSEATLRKWNFILGSLKDGHIFFRNLSKNKVWND